MAGNKMACNFCLKPLGTHSINIILSGFNLCILMITVQILGDRLHIFVSRIQGYESSLVETGATSIWSCLEAMESIKSSQSYIWL